MAKKVTTSKKAEKKSPILDDYKTQLGTLFSPWLIKKWTQSKYGSSFILDVKDAVISTSHSEYKEANVYSFTINKTATSITISPDQLNTWANGTRPTILLYKKADSKIGYLLLEEHFLNTLISENPSRSALDSVAIEIKKFTLLTKQRIKVIHEFIFKWKRMVFSIMESGTYFKYKDALKSEVSKAILEVEKLKVDANLDVLKEINEEINKAIYTVAIVGATKAGKSTIINSLVSKYVSPIDIRPTTGIPTNIVPGKEEKTEVLLQDEKVIIGPAAESFLNQWVAIDQNRSNYKKVKMVTVWVKSAQMEKGLSFCDFPGLDDADPVIEKTVSNALKFVNAIIYVIDASGMTSGFKFPKQYRDDLLNLKNKDRIFLVINKIDHFADQGLLSQFKAFMDEELDRLGLKSLFSYPPIYMTAKKSFAQRQKGIYEKDEMLVLESQVWDHLLANSKSGLHNLMNIVGQVSLESERLTRTLNLRVSHGDKQKKLQEELKSTQLELNNIKAFELQKRQQITHWLEETLEAEKKYLIRYYKEELHSININNAVPNDKAIETYLREQFTLTAPEIFEQLENQITQLHNDLNIWVGKKLQPVEITIDTYTKHQFKNSETFYQLLQPVAHIFSESYGKSVPTSMIGNIAYHIFNTLEWFGDALWDIFASARTVRNKKINGIIRRLTRCYDETFEKIFFAFHAHLEHKCDHLRSKVVDRTTVYIAGMNKQISALNNPLSESEKKLYELAIEKLTDLDNNCGAIKLQIEEQTATFKIKSDIKPDDTIERADEDVEVIEKEIRALLNTVLVKNMGTDEAKKIILSHLQPKIDDRIVKMLRDHPGTTLDKYRTFESQLQFFDMSEYFEMISNKTYWPFFKDTFNSKENLNKHILQLSNLRNAIRHSREQTKLIFAEGLASIVWFKMALKIKSSMN
jgi:ribosome biogenesis GTPase A